MSLDPIPSAMKTALEAIALGAVTLGGVTSSALRVRVTNPEQAGADQVDRYQFRDTYVALGPPPQDWAHTRLYPTWRAPVQVAVLYPSGRQAAEVEATIQDDGRRIQDGVLVGGLGHVALRAALATAGFTLLLVLPDAGPPRSEVQEAPPGPPLYVVRHSFTLVYRSA